MTLTWSKKTLCLPLPSPQKTSITYNGFQRRRIIQIPYMKMKVIDRSKGTQTIEADVKPSKEKKIHLFLS